MANFKPDDVARRCLCIDGVPGDVQLDEIMVYLTGMLDFHYAKSGKHVFLFKDEQAARSQLQKTPKIILKHGRTPNDTVCLNVNLCDVGDINTSWLYQNQPMKEQGTIYVNIAAAKEPLYQNPAQLIANNEQTYEWDRGNNPNQHQHPMDTTAAHPPLGIDPYGLGWGQYPHPSQGYSGQHGFQQPGYGQSTYSNQDGKQQYLHVPNPSQFPHGPWYGPGFQPYLPLGMGYPSPDGMHDGKYQHLPPQFNRWGWMPPPFLVQMPNASDTGQGSGYPNQQVPWFPSSIGLQHPQQFQYGSPPPYENSTGSSSKDQTEVKSAVSDAKSDDSHTETILPLSMTAESPPKEALTCHNCNCEFPTDSELHEHMRIHEGVFQTRAEAMDTGDSSTFADGLTFGKIDVKIYQGDITQEDADCIVNSSNEDLDLSKGAVSIAILKKGGKSLADECRARVDDMKQDGIAVTRGFGLNCKHLIHVVAVDLDKWRPVIDKCLLKAEQLKAKSIAFPALGTGIGVAQREIASVMFKAITDFQASGAKTVTEVRIVIFQSQIVQLFVDAARNQGSGAKPKTFFGKIYRTLKGGNHEQFPRKVTLKSAQTMRPVEQTPTVWIDEYACKKQHIDAAINKLDHRIKNDFNKTVFTEAVIKSFSPNQVSKLQRLAQQWEIQMTVELKIGRITIEGNADGIMKVSDGIHRLIREAHKKEQDKRSAELLKKLVQWYYVEITTESHELREYPTLINLFIETAYKDQKQFVTFFTIDGAEYTIDFNKMEEFSVKDPYDIVTVVRKDLIQGTVVLGLPPEILLMDTHSQQLFQDALKAGKKKVYNIRLMIVGHLGVGKTTLTKRILGEEVIEESPHNSTLGIEVHSGCCKIDHDTKKWNVENMENHFSDTDQHLVNIIHKHVKYTKGEGSFGTHVKSDVPEENQNIVKHADTETERKTAHDSVKPQSSQIVSFKSPKSSPFSNKVENTAKKNKPAQSDFDRFVERNKSLPYSDKTFSNVTILDFAGQFLFYTAHQAFMSWRTLYLLVTDITLSLDELVSGDMCQMDLSGSKKCSIQEYLMYWLNSIFSHVQQQIGNKGQCQEEESNHPPVILVATHMDKVPEGEREMQKENYFDCVGRILKDRPLRYLVKGNFAISNLGQDADIDALKQKIFELAQQQGYWGEEIPATWLALEQKLMHLKRTGVPIVLYTVVEEINQSSDVKIENSEELEVFLRFQHDLGNIVFYNTEKLRDKVVLDPNWLIDGVTTMMSPSEKLKTDHPDMLCQWYDFKDTGRLAESLIGILWSESQHEEFHNNQDHLLEVMEKLSIIASPVGDTVQNQEKYYWVPCMIHKTAPDHVKNPKPCRYITRTSTLCFVSKTKFIHVGVFHRLVASCLSKWPAAKEGDEYHIYSGCCEFLVEDCHTLLLSLSDYVILATIFLFSSNVDEPDNNICISIKEFIKSTLSDIAKCICPNSGFDVCLKCEKSSPHTTEGLLEIGRRKEVRCDCTKPAHCVNLDALVQFWVKKADSAPCTQKAAERENFSRISCLLVDIGTKVLRRLLVFYTVTPTCILPDFLKNNEKDIRDLGKKKVLTKPQLEEIFPINGTTDSKKYDISLTSALLLNLVPNLDQQIKLTIKDVRSDRNTYQAHTSSARMNSSDFRTHWARISHNLIYLCSCCNDSDFEDDISGEIESIKLSKLQDLQTRITKCEQNIQVLYSREGNPDGQI